MLIILIHFTSPKADWQEVTKADWPQFELCSSMNVEVPKKYQFMAIFDVSDKRIQAVIKLVFCFRCGSQCGHVHTDQGDWTCSGVQLEGKEPCSTLTAKLNRRQKVILNCKANTTFSSLVRGFSLP